MNLFNFKNYFNDLKSNTSKVDIVDNYIQQFGEPNCIEDCVFIDYLNQFEISRKDFSYMVPDELKDDFDWDLLARLAMASFSSDYEFVHTEKGWDLRITVFAADQKIVKNISELWSFQVLRLYEIYIEEQLNLAFLYSTSEVERDSIQSVRDKKIAQFNDTFKEVDRTLDMIELNKNLF